MVSEKKMIYEIVNEDDDDEDDEDDDDEDGRRIIPIALGLSAGGLKITYFCIFCLFSQILFSNFYSYLRNESTFISSSRCPNDILVEQFAKLFLYFYSKCSDK